MDAGEQERKGALARSARSDYGKPGPRWGSEVDPVQHVMALAVRVVDIRRDETIVCGKKVGDRRGRHLGNPDDTRERCGRELNLVLPGEQGVDRYDELLRVERRSSDGTGAQTAVDVEQSADDHAQNEGQHVARLARAEEHRSQPEGAAFPADPVAYVRVGPV